MRTHHFWVPVRLVQTGYLRLEAVTAEIAAEMADSGQFTEDDIVIKDVDHVEVLGPPHMQETT